MDAAVAAATVILVYVVVATSAIVVVSWIFHSICMVLYPALSQSVTLLWGFAYIIDSDIFLSTFFFTSVVCFVATE